ncbi:MAG TPA: RNA 2'-phosphotransferase [Puia sp.]|jgi:putative RNA 2'-phosphotransferase
MKEKDRNTISKFLSLILRHSPETIGLELDEKGWVDVEDLLIRCAKGGKVFSRAELGEVVALNDKQRFAFNEDKTKIRANQGHSVEVELQLETQRPPELLYHGTVDQFLDKIREEGLKKMNRHHVHLSADKMTAEKVGSRRGEAVILVVRSGEMSRDGFEFFLSGNGVWLTELVPERYIDFE